MFLFSGGIAIDDEGATFDSEFLSRSAVKTKRIQTNEIDVKITLPTLDVVTSYTAKLKSGKTGIRMMIITL